MNKKKYSILLYMVLFFDLSSASLLKKASGMVALFCGLGVGIKWTMEGIDAYQKEQDRVKKVKNTIVSLVEKSFGCILPQYAYVKSSYYAASQVQSFLSSADYMYNSNLRLLKQDLDTAYYKLERAKANLNHVNDSIVRYINEINSLSDELYHMYHAIPRKSFFTISVQHSDFDEITLRINEHIEYLSRTKIYEHREDVLHIREKILALKEKIFASKEERRLLQEAVYACELKYKNAQDRYRHDFNSYVAWLSTKDIRVGYLLYADTDAVKSLEIGEINFDHACTVMFVVDNQVTSSGGIVQVPYHSIVGLKKPTIPFDSTSFFSGLGKVSSILISFLVGYNLLCSK